MKKLAICLLSCIIFASCSAADTIPAAEMQNVDASSPAPLESSAAETYTIESYAEKSKSSVGEINKPYNFETQTIGSDGQNPMIGGMSIINVSYFPEFQAGTEVLKNVVVFDAFGDENLVQDFLTNNAFLVVADETGKENSNFASAYYFDRENDKLYMLFYSDEDISSCKFALLGGFARDKNKGNSTFIFEITH